MRDEFYWKKMDEERRKMYTKFDIFLSALNFYFFLFFFKFIGALKIFFFSL